MKKLRGTGGAALVWAVSALLVLSILVATMLTVASAYHSRGLRDEQGRQAYLTAKSAADTVLAVARGLPLPAGSYPSAEAAFMALAAANPWLPTPGSSVVLEERDFSLALGPLAGTVERLELTCQAGEAGYLVVMTATAAVGGTSCTLALEALAAVSAAPGGWAFDWTVLRYG